MKRITTFTVIVCSLLILVSCAETVSTPARKSESKETSNRTPSSTQIPTTELKPAAEVESAQAETPVETSPAQTTTPESSPNPSAEIEFGEPMLLEDLSRNCQSAESEYNFKNVGLPIGQTAINFTLKDTQGTEYRLSRLLAEKPVVMVFGSFT